MAAEYGLNAEWRAFVQCKKCNGDIMAFPTVLEENYVRYGFRCNGCGINGDWEELVRGYFEAKRRRRETQEKIVAPREF